MSPDKCRVPLSLIIFLRVIDNILLHSKLEESLQQSLVCKGFSPYVISTDSIVDLANDFFGFLIIEASKQRY